MNFTPGPWNVGWQSNVYGSNQIIIADVWCRAPGHGVDEEIKANACLIASAPLLLAACQMIDGWHNMRGAEFLELIRRNGFSKDHGEDLDEAQDFVVGFAQSAIRAALPQPEEPKRG